MITPDSAADLWLAPPDHLDLGSDEVHLWRVFVDETYTPDLLQPLSEDERARAERFRVESVQWQFVVSRAVLRMLLGRYLDSAPETLTFRYGPHGKPALGGTFADHPLRFNVSHTEDVALLAFTRGREVGVDVEHIHPQAQNIAAHFFSQAENAALLALPETEREAAFFRAWTRKEAFIKARGDGFALPLTNFDVSLDEAARLLSVLNEPNEAARWSMYSFYPAPDYVAALAVEAPEKINCQLIGWQWE
jgi:4'-phosphopantetheinyl transferase